MGQIGPDFARDLVPESRRVRGIFRKVDVEPRGIQSHVRELLQQREVNGRRMAVIDLAEARKAKRRAVLDMGLIRFGDMSMCCVLRNLSEAGAALGTAGRLVGYLFIHNSDDSGFVAESE